MKRNRVFGFLLSSLWALPAVAAAIERSADNDNSVQRKKNGNLNGHNLRGGDPIGNHDSTMHNNCIETNRTIETFDIDLDLPPEDRWTEVMARYGPAFHKVADWVVENTIPKDILPKFLAVFDLVEEFWPDKEYRRELEGIAKATNLPVGLLLALNLNYELNAGCTSIVAKSSDGTVWHGRNLDYSIPGLKEVTVNVRFVQKDVAGIRDAVVFEGTTYAGYIGILTGSKPGAFSLSQDMRYTGTPVWENLLEFLTTRGKAAAYPFFYRDLFESVDTYEAALERLRTTPLIAPAYAIIASASKGAGAVVSRDRNAAADTWEISEEEWFLVETNDDHWKPPEDDRREAANRNMKKLTPETIGPEALMAVLSKGPTLNELTTYTAVMNPGTGYYASVKQEITDNDGDHHQGTEGDDSLLPTSIRRS